MRRTVPVVAIISLFLMIGSDASAPAAVPPGAVVEPTTALALPTHTHPVEQTEVPTAAPIH